MSKVYEIALDMRDEGPDGLLGSGAIRAFEGIVEEVGRDLPRLGRDGLKERLMLTGDREERLLKLLERMVEALEQMEMLQKELVTVRGPGATRERAPLPPETA